MAVRFLPARTIGGDLYDFIDYGPGRTAIVLGDVSGKAAPAALFAALVSGIMRSAAAQQPAPAQMLALLNDAIQERKLESQYVTLLFALWNDENQTLQVANSGAVQPILCRTGQSSISQGRGLPARSVPQRRPMKSSPSQPSPATPSSSSPTESPTPRTPRARCTAKTAWPASSARIATCPQQIADAILADVARFQGAHDRFDDETIIVLRVR